MSEAKPTCSICAWRENCRKKFSIVDPSRCADYSRDLSIRTDEEENSENSGDKNED